MHKVVSVHLGNFGNVLVVIDLLSCHFFPVDFPHGFAANREWDSTPAATVFFVIYPMLLPGLNVGHATQHGRLF